MKHKKKKMEGKMSSASMSSVSSGMQLELLINRREKKIHKKHLRNNGEKIPNLMKNTDSQIQGTCKPQPQDK